MTTKNSLGLCLLLFFLCWRTTGPVWGFGAPYPDTKPAELKGWAVSRTPTEKGSGFRKENVYWHARLQNSKEGIDRLIPLQGIGKFSHLQFYLYPDIQRLVVFEPISNSRKENRLLIFSFEGKRLHTFGLQDLLLETEMDYDQYDGGAIRAFRSGKSGEADVTQLEEKQELHLITHTGRKVVVFVKTGVIQERKQESPPVAGAKVKKALEGIVTALPPLPEDAVPAMYTFRHGQELDVDVSSFHVEGLWVSPGHQGLAQAVSYVEEFKGFHLTVGEGEIKTVLSKETLENERILQRVEMGELLELAKSLSSFSGDRAFRQNHRRVLRDHGEAMLFAARLMQAGYPEPAITLADFYLQTFGMEVMEREVGDALHETLYREILREFDHSQNMKRFVSRVDELVANGVPRVRAIPRKTYKPIQEDPFGGGGSPFATVQTRVSEKDKDRFVPNQRWWGSGHLQENLKTWRTSLDFIDGEPPQLEGITVEDAQRNFYRTWYPNRQEWMTAARRLENTLWILLPEEMARETVLHCHYQNRNRIQNDPAFRKQVEREISLTREILHDRDTLFQTLPLMMVDPRPVPRSRKRYFQREEGYGGTYERILPVPETLSDLVSDLLHEVTRVDHDTFTFWREPTPEAALKLQEWVKDVQQKSPGEQGALFLEPITGKFHEEALYTLLANPSSESLHRVDRWIKHDPKAKHLLLPILKDYRRMNRDQADKWIGVVADHFEDHPQRADSIIVYQDLAKLYRSTRALGEIETPGKDTPEEISFLSRQLDQLGQWNVLHLERERKEVESMVLAHAWILSDDRLQSLLAERLLSTYSGNHHRTLDWISDGVASDGLKQADLTYGAHNQLRYYLPEGNQIDLDMYRSIFTHWSQPAWRKWLSLDEKSPPPWAGALISKAMLRSYYLQKGENWQRTWFSGVSLTNPIYRKFMMERANQYLVDPEEFVPGLFPDPARLTSERRAYLDSLLGSSDSAEALDTLHTLSPGEFAYLSQQVQTGKISLSDVFKAEVYRRGFFLRRLGMEGETQSDNQPIRTPEGAFGIKELTQRIEQCRQYAAAGRSGTLRLIVIPVFGEMHIMEEKRRIRMLSENVGGVTLENDSGMWRLNVSSEHPFQLGGTSSRPSKDYRGEIPAVSAKELETKLREWFTPKHLFSRHMLKIQYEPELNPQIQ